MTKPALVSRLLTGTLLTSAAIAQCLPHMPPPPPPPPPKAPSLNDNGPTDPGIPAPGGPATPGPAGPSGPRPTTPSRGADVRTPQPGGPTTGGPTGPTATPPGLAAPAAAMPGVTMPRGMPISFERGDTSKLRLKVDWLHPVPPERESEQTSAAGPLPLQDALEVLWQDDDGRPLLVLRECPNCAGSDGALFSRSLANDKTMLMTKWFRTVRLPAHITEPGHPFHNVFQGYDFKDGWPHLFLLADRDAKPVAFSGAQTQSQLWQGMFTVLGQRYAKDPKKAIKKWLGLLDRYDTLDARHRQLQEELYEVRANQGPDSSRAKKLTAALAELEVERSKLAAEEEKVQDLGLLAREQSATR